MADLNEPKKETERIGLPAPAGAKPPTGGVRPPAPPSVAPRPLPPKEEVAAGPRPPARPTTHPSAPAASGATGPPNGPPPPTGAKASVPPPPPLGLIPPSPSPVALSPGASGSSKPGLSPINRPLENRDLLQAGPRQETARVADSPLKAVKPGSVQRGSVPLAPIIRAASPVVANSPAKGLGALAPAQLCWALLGISVLTLLLQLWNYFS
jgi:hypothetical protein